MASKTPSFAQEIIEEIFNLKTKGQQNVAEVPFRRQDIVTAAHSVNAKKLREDRKKIPKNLGDVVYSLRYRTSIPKAINQKAPTGKEWAIFPAGRSLYELRPVRVNLIKPAKGRQTIHIPDSTPGVIAKYSQSDEQALLARIRYNRLLDVFTGLTCYPLQSHLRTSIAIADAPKSQVETDDLYVGIDKGGAHYILPMQAKGASDELRIIQIWQDFRVAEQKFSKLIALPVAAQFMHDDQIALFSFKENQEDGITIGDEHHYKLVPPEQLSDDQLAAYQEAADRCRYPR